MEAKSEVEEKNDNLFAHDPCNYFQQLIKAVISCLGFSSDPPDSSSNLDGDGDGDGAADPPADPPVAAELRVAPPRAPPRPPITGGRGPQTNANPN